MPGSTGKGQRAECGGRGVGVGLARAGALHRSAPEAGWAPGRRGPLRGLSDREYVSLFRDTGLFRIAFSFSKRLIFNFDSCMNLSTPWLQGVSGLVAGAASLLLLLSICKANK